jgi:hypothetical protein
MIFFFFCLLGYFWKKGIERQRATWGWIFEYEMSDQIASGPDLNPQNKSEAELYLARTGNNRWGVAAMQPAHVATEFCVLNH